MDEYENALKYGTESEPRTFDVVIEVRRWPTNEVKGDAWMPRPIDVANEIERALRHRDIDAGWTVSNVYA